MLKKRARKYGDINSMALVNPKSGRKIIDLIPVYSNGAGGLVQPAVKATADMIIRVVTTDEEGRRITFFMKKA